MECMPPCYLILKPIVLASPMYAARRVQAVEPCTPAPGRARELFGYSPQHTSADGLPYHMV